MSGHHALNERAFPSGTYRRSNASKEVNDANARQTDIPLSYDQAPPWTDRRLQDNAVYLHQQMPSGSSPNLAIEYPYASSSQGSPSGPMHSMEEVAREVFDVHSSFARPDIPFRIRDTAGHGSPVIEPNLYSPAQGFSAQPKSGGLPVNAHVPELALEQEPTRTRVACSFCRTRKLRCDGVRPCRHCERRSMECTYPVVAPKAKAGTAASVTKAGRVGAIAGISPRSGAKKRKELDGDRGADLSATGRKRSKDRQFANGRVDSLTDDPSTSVETDTAFSRRASGSDLAMIQNDTSCIPSQPAHSGREGWWEDVFTIFGGNRQFCNKLVGHLLTRFVRSNAIFFGLLHAPTLLEVVSSTDGYSRADPALYLSVLAVAACDMQRNFVSDERTADLRASSDVARDLSTRLSNLASSFLMAATTNEGGLTPAVGQAASILALVQPDGSSEQEDLINLAENVVRKLKLYESVSQREPLPANDSEPDSDLYWSRPLASETPELEVKYESIVRLCWTGLSHRLRRLIALPDEDIDRSNLPEFVLQIRPMAYWQPSLLPEDLPAPFFHSQDLMRRSAHLSRLAVTLAKLERLQEVDENGQPCDHVLAQVRDILASLDDLERTFLRHRPRTDADRINILGRTLQMFCRMHVWVRLNIWRKHGLWSPVPMFPPVPVFSSSTHNEVLTEDTRTPPSDTELHPTLEYWLMLMTEMAGQAQSDIDAHLVLHTDLRSTVSELDSLLRHTLCAFDIAQGSGQTARTLPTINVAIDTLQIFLNASRQNAKLPQFSPVMLTKMDLAASRLSDM